MLIGMLNCEGLWISIFIGRLFLRGHLCFRCDMILTNRKIYRQLGSASQSNRKRGELGSGQYQQGVVYAAKRRQAQGIATQAAAQRRRGQHTQLENTNTPDKEDRARSECEAPRCCVQCEQHASEPPPDTPMPAHSLHSSGLDGTHEQAVP